LNSAGTCSIVKASSEVVVPHCVLGASLMLRM